MSTLSTTKPHIIDEQALFATLELSFRVHTPHTDRSEALQSVYTDILLAGCGPYDRAAFLDALATIGAAGSIAYNDDLITVRFRARKEVLKKALALLTFIFEKPHFAPKELKRIQKKLTEELKLAKEDAKARAYNDFINACVTKQDSRYAYDIETIQSSVQKITIADLRAFHRTVQNSSAYYTCGGTSADCTEIERTLRKLKFHLSESGQEEELRTVKTLSTKSVALTDIPHKSNIEFSIGGVIPMIRTNPDFAPLHFGMCVLGIRGGFSGRLMSIVREKEGLTYGIYGQIEGISASLQGFWRISTFFTPKDAVQGITSTLREINRIRTQGITDDELTRFRQILSTRFRMVDDSLLKRVSERHTIALLGLTEAQYGAYKHEIAHMTKDRVNAALKRYLDPSQIVISGAGPVKTVANDLRKFAK